VRTDHTIVKRSPYSGEINTLVLNYDDADYARWWEDGELIQNAMPYLTPDEREFLMTGHTKEDWTAIFAPTPEEAANDDKHD